MNKRNIVVDYYQSDKTYSVHLIEDGIENGVLLGKSFLSKNEKDNLIIEIERDYGFLNIEYYEFDKNDIQIA